MRLSLASGCWTMSMPSLQRPWVFRKEAKETSGGRTDYDAFSCD